jgi:hypothetical protein
LDEGVVVQTGHDGKSTADRPVNAIFRVVTLYDPHNLLPGLQWETRGRMQDLAARFGAATGLHLQIRRQGGRRTCTEQNTIYAQGRTAGGDIVTYASGCLSWHVLGRAVDVDPIDSAGKMQPQNAYRTAGDMWQAMGGKWGGYFPGFPDIGHFEWHPGLTIEQVCPSSVYCSEIEASIQTSMPFGRAALIGAAVTGSVAAIGYAGWQAWQRRRQS